MQDFIFHISSKKLCVQGENREIGEKERKTKQDQNVVSKLRHMENKGHEEKRVATV